VSTKPNLKFYLRTKHILVK